MTREEAIWWVNHLFEIQKEEYFNKRMMEDAKEVEEAQHMAIDALKCKPTVIRCKELLSKEDFEAVVKRIHEQNQNVIVIPCEAEVVSTNTSTKSTNISTEPTTGALKSEPSEDLIKRSDAIEAIEIVDWYHQNNNKDMVHGANDDEHQAWYKADDVYKALEAVPSADRPRGEWIHTPNGIDRDFVWWVCSECGHKIFSETEKDRIEFHAYCGRCGAYMRGDMKGEIS